MVRMYPAIPTLQPNPTSGQPAKLDLKTLLDLYNELTGHGFRVVAKRRLAKHPVQSGWNNLKQADLKGSVQMELQSKASASGWCIITGHQSGNLVVVDLDFQELINNGHKPHDVYKEIQELSTTQYVLLTPTGGLHLYYRCVDKSVGSSTRVGYAGLDVRGDNGLVASLGGYNRYTTDAEKKGVVRNHEAPYQKLVDGRYDEVPVMSERLFQWLSGKISKTVDRKGAGANFGSDTMVANYVHTEEGNARLDAHFLEPIHKREAVVIECIDAIFEKWSDGLAYDEWRQVWMSAHHGAPTQRVLEALLQNENVYWKDAEDKRNFQRLWKNHRWKEGGNTVASLFWIARKAGWLRLTGYEIPENYVEHINVEYVTDWVNAQPELPRHALIESQTGTGKTRAIKAIWERIGKGKAVIFVPTIKLATELYYTLKNELKMPATLYRDENKGTAIELEEMKKAHILVTTLQTFATKLFASGVDMRTYDLVYVEEIDQLLAGFALGGGNKYMVSHVTENQARLGFTALADAYHQSGYVYGVDATMSQVSSSLAFQMTNDAVHIIRNDYIKPKAKVQFIGSINEAYQVAYDALRKGKRTVIVADKASRAKEAYDTMLKLSVVKEENAILMNRHTSAQRKVINFMKDVNKGAGEYKLVVYNSIMGSGVSISDVTPDVLVQVCEYLPPRNNLQMLNRYRNQSEVYVSMANSESLYAHTAEDILKEASQAVTIEAGLIRLPVTERGNTALIRDGLAAVAIADKQAQWRSPLTLYKSLLETDGRKISKNDVEMSGVMAHTLKKVREIQREQNKFIYANWHMARPVNEENPATTDMTDMEVALGTHHAMIAKSLRGNIPDVEDVETAEYISSVVRKLRKHGFALSEFMEQEKALNRAERFVLDGDKPLIAISTSISKIKAVSMLSLLYDDMREPITSTQVAHRAPRFIAELQKNKDLYNAVVSRPRERFEVQYDPDDIELSAIALARTLLRQIGLKQKKQRLRRKDASYQIWVNNMQEVEDFLGWRNADNPDYKLTYVFTDQLEGQLAERKDTKQLFADMTEEATAEVIRLVKENVDFTQAVEMVDSGLVM
jgi:hypothetical protein